MCHHKLENNLFLNNNNISFMFELLDYPTKVKESINVSNVMLVMNCQNIAADIIASAKSMENPVMKKNLSEICFSSGKNVIDF